MVYWCKYVVMMDMQQTIDGVLMYVARINMVLISVAHLPS